MKAKGDSPVEAVPYVPTSERVARAVLAVAGVGRRDVVYDLGMAAGLTDHVWGIEEPLTLMEKGE